MGDHKRQRVLALARRMIAVALPCLLSSAILMGSTAQAAETHTFNAALSLTGGCSTSSLDLVPDPGCPGGFHPSVPFAAPKSVITDARGDLFVANWGSLAAEGAAGRIDIFNPEGSFLGEIPDSRGPVSIAIDSQGNLYVLNHRPGNFENQVVRYVPTVFKPESEEIEYASTPVVVVEGEPLPEGAGLAVNQANDRLFVHFGNWISEFGSAAEKNEFLQKIGSGTLQHGTSVAVDAAHGKIYASDSEESLAHSRIRVFELATPNKLIGTIEGPGPEDPFLSQNGLLSVAADEETGHLFVYDANAPEPVVYEFTDSGEYVSTISHKFKEVFYAKIGLANGASNLNRGYLFVPSNESGVDHSYAFEPITEFAPEIASVSFEGITLTESEVLATINPQGAETEYRLEYTTQESFEAEGFIGALVAGQGVLPAGSEPVVVAAPITGLTPGTSYRVRVVAANGIGEDEGQQSFSTYQPGPTGSCLNDVFRVGASAALADCRAYELVTPSDTNGREPMGVGHLGAYFTTLQAAPSGERVSFRTEGGTLPGSEGTGNLGGDPYLAVRRESGWSTAGAGPTGSEAEALTLGGISPDQGFSFWGAGTGGSAYLEGTTNYVRYPDGQSHLIGEGALGVDREAEGRLISPTGNHIIFASDVRLENDSPSAGVRTVYDRTVDGGTQVVSLLPNGIASNEATEYKGASIDGKGVAFVVGGVLYLRSEDTATYEIGKGLTFAGISKGAKRVFYLNEGNLWSFEPEGEGRTQFTATGDVTVVNIASDGTRAYFTSPTALSGLESPTGAIPQGGEENLYLSEEGAIKFLGAVTQRDVAGTGNNDRVDGLGNWVASVSLGDGLGGFGADPSRTTPDGTVLLFESRAGLTSYDSGGHAEIYRYDSVGNDLTCLSCNPTKVPAQGEASLESVSQQLGEPEPFSAVALVENLRPDGRRAFFQSDEALVPGDTDGLQDVYEWEDQGVGSCARAGGCVYLISSGHSLRNDYLYAVSESGDDVFFRTGDLLVGSDAEETPSIYDARVDGGFPEEDERPCQGEGCRPDLTPPPLIPGSETGAQTPSGNLPPSKNCPKGKHKVKRQGKEVCVKKKRHHRTHKHGKKGRANESS